jgi:hypothetical protein
VLLRRELFDTEQEAARAYDTAVWRLKPREARNYANFKDSCPPDVAEALKAADKVRPVRRLLLLVLACDVHMHERACCYMRLRNARQLPRCNLGCLI